MDTADGLIQASSCWHTNQASSIRRLEKLNTMCEYSHQIDNNWGHISKVMICKTGQKNMTLNGGSISSKTCRFAGLVERKNEILEQQIKLLIAKPPRPGGLTYCVPGFNTFQ